MTSKDEIINISREINDLLSVYVAIHDDVFKFSIRHALPIPGIFKSIDFGSHIANIEIVASALKRHAQRISMLIARVDREEKDYLSLLLQYAFALIETGDRFETVLKALYAKSQSFVNSNYDWKNYKNDLAKYEEAVQNYMAFGGKLNDSFQKIK